MPDTTTKPTFKLKWWHYIIGLFILISIFSKDDNTQKASNEVEPTTQVTQTASEPVKESEPQVDPQREELALHFTNAQTYFQQGKFNDARSELDKALDIKSDHEASLVLRDKIDKAENEKYDKWAQEIEDYWNKNGSGVVYDVVWCAGGHSSLWVEVSGYNEVQARELARLICLRFKNVFPEEDMICHIFSPYPDEIAKYSSMDV